MPGARYPAFSEILSLVVQSSNELFFAAPFGVGIAYGDRDAFACRRDGTSHGN